MSKKSHHFLTLWPWPLTYDFEKLIRSGHYHYQCVYQIWEQSIPWFLSYRVNTIAGGGQLRRKTITSPDPSDTGDIITLRKWRYLWTNILKDQTNFLSINHSPKYFYSPFPLLTFLFCSVSPNEPIACSGGMAFLSSLIAPHSIVDCYTVCAWWLWDCQWDMRHGWCLGLILGLRPANERGRYFVTTSLIGWAQA